MPALLRIADEPAPSKSEVRQISNKVQESLTAAEKAQYRLQTMLEPEPPKSIAPEKSPDAKTPDSPPESEKDPRSATAKLIESADEKEDLPAGTKK
jgi:hypothetical protein